MFTGEKAIWKSKGVLAGVALIVVSLFGFEYNADTLKMINENMEAISGLILTGVMIWSRLNAKETLVAQPMVGTISHYTPSSPTTLTSPATSLAAAAGADMVSAGMELKMYALPSIPSSVDETLPKG